VSEVTAAEPALVRRRVEGAVATLTLDSPANRNALSRRLVAELDAALDAAVADPTVRVIVLTGAGPAFCAGADLAEQRSAAPDDPPLGRLPALMQRIWSAPQPVVARLNGPVRAGGVGLAAACDLVVAPDEATFAFTEVRLGVVPAMIAVPVLRRLTPQVAHRLFLTGDTFAARTAYDIGLIDVVADPGGLDAATDGLVGRLLRGGPEAIALTKPLRDLAGAPADEVFPRLIRLSAERFASAEGQEGLRAFAEKRDPSWVGP
jgi:methylglutaconyl-CoA hydratase